MVTLGGSDAVARAIEQRVRRLIVLGVFLGATAAYGGVTALFWIFPASLFVPLVTACAVTTLGMTITLTAWAFPLSWRGVRP